MKPLLFAVLLAFAGGPGPDDLVRLRPLVVDADDRTVLVVPVPVPEELRGGGRVRWTAGVRGGAALVGRAAGEFGDSTATATTSATNLLLTVRLPADASAGLLEVAEVTFRHAQGTVVLPIQVRIDRRRQLRLSGSPLIADLRPGDRLELGYRLFNEGNGAETLYVRVTGPADWRISPDRPTQVVVARRGELDVVVRVSIPMTTGVGDQSLLVSVADTPSATDAPLALTRTTMRVVPAVVSNGLLLKPMVAIAAGTGAGSAVAGATLDGAVTEEVRLTARYSPRPRRTGIANQGLASVGAFATPFTATLSASDWSLTAGNAMTELSSLAGVNVMGEGLSGRAQRGEYEARAVVARPTSGFGATGHLLGGGVWRDTDLGRIGGVVSHLEERGGLVRGRALTALALDFRSAPLGAWTIGSGLAYRGNAETSGAGVALGATRATERDRLHVRVEHAPGGSAAFARATDEWELQGARTLNERWSVDASYARSDDAGNVFRRLRTENLAVGQRYQLSERLALSARAQADRFSAASSDTSFGGFGAGSQQLSAALDWRHGPLAVSAEGSVGSASRRTDLLGGRSVETVAGQQGIRLYASRGLERLGLLDASVSGQFTGAGIGVPAAIWIGAARWSGVPASLLGRTVRLDQEVQLQRLTGMPAMLVLRSSASTALPGGLELALSAERNPFYRDADGRAGWIAAMRISVGAELLTPSARGPAGVVFVDRNRNARRDPDEPTVSGVVVRRGDARARTGKDGTFRLPSNARGRTRVEQGSLPRGLLAHPRVAADSAERREIPLLVTGSITLDLRLVASEDGRRPVVTMRDVRVTLEDETGFAWVGRRLDDSTLVFEDIPAGHYRPRFDLSLLAEPVRVDDVLSVTVEERGAGRVELPLRGRALRITVPRSRTGTGGTRTRDLAAGAP